MNYSGMIKYLPAVLLFCSCTESGLLLRERERFAVHFSASGIGMEVTTRASSPLSDNTTLRILAFRRVGQSPNLQADEYMGEGTYRASLGNGSLTPVHSLLLRAGSYDFYALTPETATASGGRWQRYSRRWWRHHCTAVHRICGAWHGLCHFADRG